MKAEVKAIDNEFFERENRHVKLLNCFRCHSSKQSHPFHNIFAAGNQKSLLGGKLSYKELYKKVANFYLQKYKGNLMKLVVIGGESLHVLQGWVERFFKSLKKCQVKGVMVPKITRFLSNQTWAQRHHLQSKNKNRRRLSKKASIWKSGVMYQIAESNNENVLKLSWTLPCLRNQYQYHPERYVSYLFNHYGKGSLCSFLKKCGWAVFVDSAVEGGICMTSAGYVFVITVILTDSGLLEVNRIILVIYQYLNFLRGSPPPEWIFEEIKKIGGIRFNIGEEPQDEYAIRLSENLLFYEAKHVIYADYWCKRWDENLIKQILDYFVPTNMRVEVFSSSFKKEVTQLEPWYGTWYSVHDIDGRWMKLWKNTKEVHESLDFPNKNPFILYENFDGVGDSGDFSNLTAPKLLVNEEMLKFWYKKDDTSKASRVAIRIGISFKSTCDNARNSALSTLFVDLLIDHLFDDIHQARMAMMDAKLSFSDGMIQLEVLGFDKKIHILLSKILSQINCFIPTDVFRFELLKEDMRREFLNTSDEFLEILLLKHAYENDEKGSYLGDNLSFNDMKEFIQDIRSQVFIMGLCIGNITEDGAYDICNSITPIFHQNPLPIPSRQVEKVICLPPNQNYVVDFSGDEGNSLIQLYFQIGQNLFESPRLIALLELFATIVDHDFFDDLRNKKHLGYTVECSINLLHNVWGLEFHILTPNHKPRQIQPIIQNYIDNLEEFLKTLDEEVIKNYLISLAETLSCNGSLKEKTNQFWGEIIKYRCNFNFTQGVVRELEHLKKEHLFQFYKKYFKKSSVSCKWLWVTLDGSGEAEIEEGDDEDDVYVEVIPKKDLDYYEDK